MPPTWFSADAEPLPNMLLVCCALIGGATGMLCFSSIVETEGNPFIPNTMMENSKEAGGTSMQCLEPA